MGEVTLSVPYYMYSLSHYFKNTSSTKTNDLTL